MEFCCKTPQNVVFNYKCYCSRLESNVLVISQIYVCFFEAYYLMMIWLITCDRQPCGNISTRFAAKDDWLKKNFAVFSCAMATDRNHSWNNCRQLCENLRCKFLGWSLMIQIYAVSIFFYFSKSYNSQKYFFSVFIFIHKLHQVTGSSK